MRCSAFDLFHNIRDTLLRINAHEHVNVVYMTFHGKYIYIVRLAFNGSQFFESLFDTRDIKNLPTVSWAEHKMIVYQ